MKVSILGLLVVLMSVQAFAQNSAEEQGVIKLSKEKWQWMADKNADTLATLFHDQSVFVHMGGSWGKIGKSILYEVEEFITRKQISTKYQ